MQNYKGEQRKKFSWCNLNIFILSKIWFGHISNDHSCWAIGHIEKNYSFQLLHSHWLMYVPKNMVFRLDSKHSFLQYLGPWMFFFRVHVKNSKRRAVCYKQVDFGRNRVPNHLFIPMSVLECISYKIWSIRRSKYFYSIDFDGFVF